MLKEKLAQVVGICTRHAWLIIAIGVIAGIGSGYYGARHFAIDTDIGKLISPDLPWRQRELAFMAAFPQRIDTIFVVVDAPTSELAGQASSLLTEKLKQRKDVFQTVEEPGNSPLFVRNGLLFLPTEDVKNATSALAEAEPVVKVVQTDPSLRGLVQALAFVMAGIQVNRITLDDMARGLNLVNIALEDTLDGKPASFSWRELMNGKPLEPMDLRRFIQIRPILDYQALEPGRRATDAIRKTAAELDLAGKYQARVRLTGPVPIQDEEFATLQEGALLNAICTVLAVIFILWLALKSPKIIFAMCVTMLIGLLITGALGLWMVHAFNPISIAAAVLFVGIGVDFGIQYTVRYRAERFERDDLSAALANAARNIGAPLTLAAAATAAGFFSFLPTAYGGFSELGAIAGVGMIVAYVVSLTILPALLKVLNPPGEKEPLGFRWLAPVDHFTERHRIPFIAVTALVVFGGMPLLYFLQFDFNPMNLRSPKAESIATYLDLRRDPATGASAIDVLAPSLAVAKEMSERLTKVPEVSKVMTLDTFVPDDQQAKLAYIQKAAAVLGPTLAEPVKPPPTDAENIAQLNRAVDFMTKAAANQTGSGAGAAKRLAADLTRLAKADPAMRAKAQAVFVDPLKVTLDGLRELLKAEPVTAQSIPPEFAKDWIKPNGEARVQIYPTGDPNDNEVLRQFARAVLAVEPTATGGPIAILEAGHTVTRAFMQAGFTALVSISLLLWITLRRIGDVLLTLIPLLLAGVLTLEICVLIGTPLNFANIIALPLLLGVGVAFKIYYIMAWRAGQTGLLESSLTRAVVFSAATTATAFGSLWFSSHPGTSSMGKLLALTLVCTLFAAVLFQPLLMGPPREKGKA
jgi:hopanoid biosynthesis associated RND transporter like protein HpnN